MALYSDSIRFEGGDVWMTQELHIPDLTAGNVQVTDVISGQINDLSNLTSDNRDFTELRALEALSDTLAFLICLIADLQQAVSGRAFGSFTCGTSTVTFNCHDYRTVQIGDQCWFVENLRSTR